MKTKERILLASIRLFNESGISNIKLQNIADECNISVGNLAYHFKYKEDLMNAIAEQVNDEIILTVNSAKELPTLIDFDNQLSRYFALINKYAFFFLDIVELKRSYSKIHHKRIGQIELLIHQINSWIARNVDKQNI